MLKRTVLNVLKIVLAIAGVVALFVPFGTFNQLLIFFVSIAIIIGCLIALGELGDDQGGNIHWPPKNNR